MNVLVTNDDGILSEGIWTLVRELRNVARVTIVAPDRERSAIGTAVSLRQPLKVQKIRPLVPGVEAYSVDGTPSDSVILALGKLIEYRVDLVVSGINLGSNLGEDVHISGTVGAALQGYLRGFSALAISAPNRDEQYLDSAARVATALIEKLGTKRPARRIFLNMNLPALPLAEITGIEITRLARESHINTVEEGNHGHSKYLWLERQMTNGAAKGTDIRAIEQGSISITALYFQHEDKPPFDILNDLCSGLLQSLRVGK